MANEVSDGVPSFIKYVSEIYNRESALSNFCSIGNAVLEPLSQSSNSAPSSKAHSYEKAIYSWRGTIIIIAFFSLSISTRHYTKASYISIIYDVMSVTGIEKESHIWPNHLIIYRMSMSPKLNKFAHFTLAEMHEAGG